MLCGSACHCDCCCIYGVYMCHIFPGASVFEPRPAGTRGLVQMPGSRPSSLALCLTRHRLVCHFPLALPIGAGLSSHRKSTAASTGAPVRRRSTPGQTCDHTWSCKAATSRQRTVCRCWMRPLRRPLLLLARAPRHLLDMVCTAMGRLSLGGVPRPVDLYQPAELEVSAAVSCAPLPACAAV